MSIKEVYCQDKAISFLQRALTAGKVAHAYIFAGPDGIGRFKTAREWAKVLLCEDKKQLSPSEFDSCGSCRSCEAFENDIHPDFSHIHKELVQFTKKGKGKKTPVNLPIDVIREFLIEKVSTRPALSQSKVFVVSEAEKLNRESQNAMLKVLEEPPGYCFIVMLCTRMEKLLPTTQSRCQVVRFGPVAEEKIIEALAAIDIDKTQAKYWARFSQGSVGTAMKWAKLGEDGVNCYEKKKELISRLATYKLAEALDFAGWLSSTSKEIADCRSKKEPDRSKSDITRDAQKALIMMVISGLNDAIKLNVSADEAIVNSDQADSIRAFAGRGDAEWLAQMVASAYETMVWVDAAVNEKLVFEQLLLNLAVSDTMAVS